MLLLRYLLCHSIRPCNSPLRYLLPQCNLPAYSTFLYSSSSFVSPRSLLSLQQSHKDAYKVHRGLIDIASAIHKRNQSKLANVKDRMEELQEKDIEETFVRGSGPGGQKINKTSSCVKLKHRPTGITVRCQESRSQARNRVLARKILTRKVDELIRGELSLAAQEAARERARKARRRRRSIKKHYKSRRDRAMDYGD